MTSRMGSIEDKHLGRLLRLPDVEGGALHGRQVGWRSISARGDFAVALLHPGLCEHPHAPASASKASQLRQAVTGLPPASTRSSLETSG